MSKKIRMHVVLPPEIAKEFRKTVEKRKWSDFMAEAVREKLDRMQFEHVVLETAGSLGDDDDKGLSS